MSNDSPEAENELQRRMEELKKTVDDLTANLAANNQDFVNMMELALNQYPLIFREGDPLTREIRKLLKNICDRCPPCCKAPTLP